MRKAVITGFFSGIIISLILIGATYVRTFLPDTFTANLFFFVFFFSSVAGILWLSLSHYCRTSAVRWMSLTCTGVLSSIIAALIVGIFRSPISVALQDLRDLLAVLLITSLAIAAIYYIRNRNRVPHQHFSKNEELIF